MGRAPAQAQQHAAHSVGAEPRQYASLTSMPQGNPLVQAADSQDRHGSQPKRFQGQHFKQLHNITHAEHSTHPAFVPAPDPAVLLMSYSPCAKQ